MLSSLDQIKKISNLRIDHVIIKSLVFLDKMSFLLNTKNKPKFFLKIKNVFKDPAASSQWGQKTQRSPTVKL